MPGDEALGSPAAVPALVQVQVVRVFTDEGGDFGNPLGVVLDPGGIPPALRQAIATELGYSETVYVDDVAAARVQIFTPSRELPLAGHPLVGLSWVLARETGSQPDLLRPVRVTEPVPTFAAGGATWIRAAVADAPPWDHEQLATAAEVDQAAVPAPGEHRQKTQLWAWLDEPAGAIRARVFAHAFGIPEDEACGSATLMLAAALGRPISVRHGRGSVVLARPAEPGIGEVGGRVVFDHTLAVDTTRLTAGTR